jgi:flagellar hook-associated protein FlgK
MQGRIVGTKEDPNLYDPANNLFHGMNRSSALGNLEKAGQKRIDNINKTLARQAKKGKQSQTLIDRRDKFERELTEYRNEKNNHNINSAKKKGIDTTKLNPNEMRNVAQTGNAEGNTDDGGKIVCTMMNQSYGFGSFRNKIWMKFHGNIAPEYQKGYHKLFLPLVNYAKQKGITNKIIKNILEHIAVHSTIDMRQTLRGKRHTLGRLYRKVILPLCYWAGKK